jgi:hypothetical protein
MSDRFDVTWRMQRNIPHAAEGSLRLSFAHQGDAVRLTGLARLP